MANTIINGMQWGDEGKGKIVDLLCPAFDAVIRFQGGDNAGHTVKFADQHFALHLVPSGVVRPGMSCVLGSGMVINPDKLFEELDGLEAAGIDVDGRVFISNRAHVITPLHLELDRLREAALGKDQIGTTARGIGPTYESKASRGGIRMCDLGRGDIEPRVSRLFERCRQEGEGNLNPALGIDSVVALCREWGSRLSGSLANTEALINGWVQEGRSLLFEGAQGTLLDLDHGTYPYVTSSSPTAGGACAGAGIPPTSISGVVGILKAYTTRVGGGPFVTELNDQVGEYLQKRGNEYGTTTGRPRRCGWLDLVAAQHSRMIGGIDCIALTKLDVLDDLDEIRVCVGYRHGAESLSEVPALIDDVEACTPIYESLPGWKQSTVGALTFDSLPKEARDYITFIEERLEASVDIVSTGPRREETIVREGGRLAELTGHRLTSSNV
jgi:adenylosuccinate synthase